MNTGVANAASVAEMGAFLFLLGGRRYLTIAAVVALWSGCRRPRPIARGPKAVHEVVGDGRTTMAGGRSRLLRRAR